MLNFRASVLKTPPSKRRISRRMTLSRVVVFPTKVMRLTKYLLPLLHPHRHVDGRRARGRWREGRLFRRRRLARLDVGVGREFVVAERAVDFPGLLERLPDLLLAVEGAGLHPEDALQAFTLDDRVAVEREVANAVALPFGDRDPKLDVPGPAVGRVVHVPQLGLADAGHDVAFVPVVLDDRVGVLLELPGLVRAAPGDPRPHPLGLVALHLAFELAVRGRLVADEVDLLHLDPRALVEVEGQVDELRAARHLGDRVGDAGELVALLREHAADDALDAPDEGRVDERVEPDRHALFAELLFDFRLLDLLGSRVVDDLDALALLHVEAHFLAHHAVVVGNVPHLDPQVVEEVGGPQPLEVLEHDLLGRVVVRHPDAVARPARAGLDVEEIRLGLDDRDIPLRGKLQADRPEQRRRPRGRQDGSRRGLLQPLARRSRRALRRRRAADRRSKRPDHGRLRPRLRKFLACRRCGREPRPQHTERDSCPNPHRVYLPPPAASGAAARPPVPARRLPPGHAMAGDTPRSI